MWWCGKCQRLLGFLLLVSVLQIMSLRSPTVSHGLQVPNHLHVELLEAKKEVEEGGGGGGQGDVHGDAYGGFGTAGSRPPSCKRKCGVCSPCTAIQVPATAAAMGHLQTQYANYEPEGWKCKCGSSFYNP